MCKLILYYPFIIYSVFALDQQKDTSLTDGRIIGGHEVTITQFPYQASIQYDGSHICGGAIIGRAWIITAAHCFDNLSPYPSRYSVRVGSSFRNIGGQVIDFMYYVVNSYYSNTTFDYDVAVIHLLNPISLSNDAQIIGLPDHPDFNFESTIGKATGWGSTTAAGRPTDVLRAVEVPVMIQTLCNELYPSLITRRMMCAGQINGGVAACTGDGGGPLAVNSELVGIFSWSKGCAEPQQPNVFTNIFVIGDWITLVTGI